MIQKVVPFILIASLFLFFVPTSFGQGDLVQTKNAKESLKIAQELYTQGDLVQAKRQLKYTIKIKENFAIAHRILGKVYFDLEEYKEAIASFEKSFELDDKLSRASFFECAEAYLLDGQVDLAQYYYKKFKEMQDKRYANVDKESGLEQTYLNLLEERQRNILYINQLDSNATYTTVVNLGKQINSKHDEYLPSITSDGQFLLYTRNIKDENENILLSFYEKERWSFGKPINGKLKTDNNEGMAKFEAHGNTFYFAGCNRAEAEETNDGCDIYQAVFNKGKVSEITSLKGRLNSYYWDSQPSISCDGRKLFFASTREGGFGGADIWVSSRLATGEWGVPKNMGPNINTPGDEEAPFIATDGVTFFFTSDGHPGQGNGDIFISYLEENEWSPADNLGYPINSPAKELGIYVQGDNQTAYFSSARKGGEGGLDVYTTTIPSLFQPQAMVQLEGFVTDKETNEPIQTTIKIGNDGNSWEIQTNQDGWFFQCLAGNKGCSFQIQEQGYEQYIDAVFLEPQNNTSNQMVQIQLVPDKVAVLTEKTPFVGEDRLTKTVTQVYFDFDSSAITETNISKLNKISTLINKYDDWTVQVVGFADNVGDEAYNKALSQKRADEVVQFLQQKVSLMINTDINVIGKGATGETETEESRRKSRRVDVVLTR